MEDERVGAARPEHEVAAPAAEERIVAGTAIHRRIANEPDKATKNVSLPGLAEQRVGAAGHRRAEIVANQRVVAAPP